MLQSLIHRGKVVVDKCAVYKKYLAHKCVKTLSKSKILLNTLNMNINVGVNNDIILFNGCDTFQHLPLTIDKLQNTKKNSKNPKIILNDIWFTSFY